MSTEIDARKLSSPPPTPTTPSRLDEVFEFVGLEEVEKFVEREYLLTDSFEYPRNGSDPGLVLIFNQEDFTYDKSRMGTRRDVNELVLCLQRQGFNIGKENIVHNATTQEITEKLKEVSERDLSEHNCLMVFFLTHGLERDQLVTYNSSISTYDIWKNFTRCTHLDNKPKMFVFQACKGDNFSTTLKTPITEEPSKIVEHNTFSPTYLGRDMLVVYSTIEGNVSFRSPLTGSWFIQELCKNFNAYGKRDDVVTLITRTTKCVTGNYFHNEEGVNKKQMPVCMSTLSKKFYLNRNKDRAMVLMYKNHYENLRRQICEIEDIINRNLS